MRLFPRLFFLFALFAGALFILLLSASSYRPHYGYKPYYMKRADLEKSVVYHNQPREMVEPGKIYVLGDMLFINEKYQGVHVVDNSNPASPTPVAFIAAPGCIDMAAKGDILYLDNAVDLVAFSISTKAETHRIKDAFPPPISPRGQYISYIKGDEYVPVGWKSVKR